MIVLTRTPRLMAVRPFCITFNFGLITYIITITTSKQISRPKLWLFLTSAISQQFHKTCKTKQALPNCSGTLSRWQAPTGVSSTYIGNYGNFQDFSFVQSILALKLFKSPMTFWILFQFMMTLPFLISISHNHQFSTLSIMLVNLSVQYYYSAFLFKTA